MGFLKKLLVEEIPQEVSMMDEELYMDEEIDISVNTDQVSQDNLIEDIYNQNNLSDLSKSIFKVEELINSLPKEMPNETKKATVLSILSSFELTVDEVIEDGQTREAIVSSALNAIVEENKEIISDNNIAIEQKKTEIQDLEKDNSDRETVMKNTEDKIEAEMKRISDLITFIGGAK